MKWADSPDFVGTVEPHPPPEKAAKSNGAVIPYVEPVAPVGDAVIIAFTITGHLPAESFSTNVSNLQAAVDMLREVGGEVECNIKPPGKVRL
jgi:hypothetical protein